jgi:hypothetical protein
MTATTSMSVFHQWLLADPASQTSACAIVLHGDDTWTHDHLIREITDYLNEYDDDGDGRWLPASDELIAKISRDPNHRRLLGMDGCEIGGNNDSRDEFLKTLAALGQRGHVVLRSPGVSDEALQLANTFHAGIGSAGTVTGKCHVILNPDLMDHKCIAHIVGDVFLEWLHCEMRRSVPIQDIR